MIKPRDLLPNLPHEGPPIPRFLTPFKEKEGQEEKHTEVKLDKPGCVAADEVLTVLGHLNGLAEGWGGFGVLRTSKERLERAQHGARQMGAESIAEELEGIIEMLENVRDSESASALAQLLTPIAREAWELGKKCGNTSLTTEKALKALDMIKNGAIKFK